MTTEAEATATAHGTGIDLSKSFDMTYALSALYLWLLFNFLSKMINCDLQRFMADSDLVRHLVAVVSFFFLFCILDPESVKAGLAATWVKTIAVYLLFVCAIKSKWYFAVPVLVLLLVDQSIKLDAKHKGDEATKARAARVSRRINYAIIALIGVGFVQYGALQYRERGADFSLYKLVVASGCKRAYK